MIYSMTTRSVTQLALRAALEINTPGTLGVKIYEIGVTNVVATAVAIGLGYPTTGGTSPTYIPTTILEPEEDSALPASRVQFATSWGVTPLIASATASPMIRRASLTGAIGAGVVWTFPKGLYVPPGAQGLTALCLFNIIAVPNGLDIWINYDE